MKLLCTVGWHCFREVGAGESIHHYAKCVCCDKRTVQLATTGYQPLRAEWLNGGSWDTTPPKTTAI